MREKQRSETITEERERGTADCERKQNEKNNGVRETEVQERQKNYRDRGMRQTEE